MVGKFETNKDLIQELTASGAQRVGNIVGLITGTVAGVAREIGEFITDAIEMQEAAAAARRDAEQDGAYVETADLDAPVEDIRTTATSFGEPVEGAEVAGDKA